MPVSGITAADAHGLSFNALGYRTWYSLLYIVVITMDTLLTVNMVFHGKLDVRNLEPVIFHCSILLASVKFLQLARQWPSLMRSWQAVESEMPPFSDWLQREALAKRIKILTFVLLTVSLMEHLLATISQIHFANYCPARDDPIESYFVSVSSQIFFVFEYQAALGLLGKLINVLLTFGWSYMDVFVMLVSIGLSSLLSRLQFKLESHKGETLPEAFWTRIRLQYRLVCDLIALVDDAVADIIMLSFANNLYFVCIQLLKSLNKMPSTAHAVYFYFSLGFLLARTLAVSLHLAEVNERSRQPLQSLRLVPQIGYHIEVERLAYEIASDTIALTGAKYFNVTRKLVLTVVGTILTYELVLIQFHEDQNLWHCDAA